MLEEIELIKYAKIEAAQGWKPALRSLVMDLGIPSKWTINKNPDNLNGHQYTATYKELRVILNGSGPQELRGQDSTKSGAVRNLFIQIMNTPIDSFQVVRPDQKRVVPILRSTLK